MNNNNDKSVLNITILGKEYKIGCPYELQNSLFQAGQYLDLKMREIRDKHHVVGLDKVAILAALHISHQLLNNDNQNKQDSQQIQEKIKKLENKVSEAIETDSTISFSD